LFVSCARVLFRMFGPNAPVPVGLWHDAQFRASVNCPAATVPTGLPS
jgi:hypothetical protein